MQDFSELRRKILVNWVKLFTGSSAGAALGLVATTIMTRTIGLADVGVVSVIQSFWRMLEQFLSFQSYQVLIKYGADALSRAHRRALYRIFRICLMADLSMALFGAFGGAGVFYIFRDKMNIPPELLLPGIFGLMTMMTMVTGAPMGILRLYDKINIVAVRDIITALLRVVLNFLIFLGKGSVEQFIYVWVVTEAIGNVTIFVFGLRELVARGQLIPDGAAEEESEPPQIWPIVKALFKVNLGTMIRILTEEGDTLLVNALTGAEAAGKYKIAKNFAGIAYKFTGPLAQSIYPEIARAVSDRDKGRFRHIMIHTTWQGGALGAAALICWALLGKLVISHTVGPQYADALPVILIITAGYSAGFVGIGFPPALYAFNRLNHYLFSAVLCTVMYFVVAIPLLPIIGVIGSALGQVACYLSGLIVATVIVLKAYRSHDWARDDVPGLPLAEAGAIER